MRSQLYGISCQSFSIVTDGISVMLPLKNTQIIKQYKQK